VDRCDAGWPLKVQFQLTIQERFHHAWELHRSYRPMLAQECQLRPLIQESHD